MKKIFSMFFLGIALLYGCNDTQPKKGDDPAIIESPALADSIATDIANSTTSFAFSLFKTLQAEQTHRDSGNIFISPLGIHFNLGMLASGANDTTRVKILHAMKADSISLGLLNAYHHTLMNELSGSDNSIKLGLANSIWYRNGFEVEKSFLHIMDRDYKATITPLAFEKADIATINNWAAKNTNNKITDVIKDFLPDMQMLLMNMIYFKGNWVKEFSREATVEDTFKLAGGAAQNAQMMHQEDHFTFYEKKAYKALQMNYRNSNICATLLLPNEKSSIPDLLKSFTAAEWDSLQNNMYSKKVIVKVPKFILKQSTPLDGILKNMGLQNIFEKGNAGLTGINKSGEMYVTKFMQSTYLDVNEEGTEAAAVTSNEVTGILDRDKPSTFICNRPFIFIISEKKNNTILFIGSIMNPR